MNEAPNFCPICRASLRPDDLRMGKCPSCGQPLPGFQPQGPEVSPYRSPQPPGVPPAPPYRPLYGPPSPPPGAYGYGPPMPPPAGYEYGPGVPRKSVVGIIALVAGILALVTLVPGLYGMSKVMKVFGDEMAIMAREMKDKGQTVSQEDQVKMQVEMQRRLQGKMFADVLLVYLLCPAAALALTAGILGIVGVGRKGYAKGAAVAGLLLGIGSILGMIGYMIAVSSTFSADMMRAMGRG